MKSGRTVCPAQLEVILAMKKEKMEGVSVVPRVKREFRLRKEVLKIIEERKKTGEYSSYSDFLEDAVLFYNGILDTQENRAFLGDEIIKAMKAIVHDAEGRIFSHFRSQDISLSMLAVLFAANLTGMTNEEIDTLRNQAVEYVDNNFRAKSFVTALREEQKAKEINESAADC